MDKDEVVKAIERRNPKRLPCWYSWLAAETIVKYGNAVKDLFKNYTDDFIVETIMFGFPQDLLAQTEWHDEWGITWKRSSAAGAVGVDSELRDWSNLGHYLKSGFPDLDLPGRFDHIVKTVTKNHNTYIIATWWFCQLEMFRALRGTENFLMDLYLNNRELTILGEALTDFFINLIRRLAKYGINGILLSDDFGTQQSLLFSPKQWRELFKPWYSQMIREIHYNGMHALLHTCGNIEEILPDLIELGLDVIHPIQANAMDQEKIAKEFGGKISFFGGIDVQTILPKGTPQEVTEHIKWLIEIFGRYNGGYLPAPGNAITPDTPLVNIEAMCKSLREYSKYR